MYAYRTTWRTRGGKEKQALDYLQAWVADTQKKYKPGGITRIYAPELGPNQIIFEEAWESVADRDALWERLHADAAFEAKWAPWFELVERHTGTTRWLVTEWRPASDLGRQPLFAFQTTWIAKPRTKDAAVEYLTKWVKEVGDVERPREVARVYAPEFAPDEIIYDEVWEGLAERDAVWAKRRADPAFQAHWDPWYELVERPTGNTRWRVTEWRQ